MSGRGQDRGGRGQSRGGGRGGDRGGSTGGGRGGERGRGDFRGRGDRGGGRGGFSGGGSDNIFRPEEGTPQPSPEVMKVENALIESNKAVSLKKLSLSEIALPNRPAYGTLGDKIILRVNYFHLLPKPKQALYRYSISLEPDEPIVRKRRQISALLLEDVTFAPYRDSIATDHRSTLISATELNLGADGRKAVRLTYRDQDEVEARPNARTYVIKVQKSRTIPLSELLTYLSSTSADAQYDQHDETVQALNIVMSRKPTLTPDVVPVGRNKYFPIGPQARMYDLRGGLVALRGYYASVRTATLRTLINVNVCTAAFYKPGPLLDLMRDFRAETTGPMPQSLEGFLRRLRVETKYLKKKGVPSPKVKTIISLARPPSATYGGNAKQAMFDCDELDGRVTVEDFFRRKHQITLAVPLAPVVNVGTIENPVLIPPELCTVLPGQVSRRLLTGNQTTEMIQVACQRPAENARLIVGEGARIIGMSQGNQNPLAAFGLKVEPQMLTVDGRILAAPTVSYANGPVIPESGSWNMFKKRFSVGAAIKDWSFLRLRDGNAEPLQDSVPELIRAFKGAMDVVGMRADNPKPPNGFTVSLLQDDNEKSKQIKEVLEKIQKSGVKMLLVILPSQKPFTYARVKYFADTQYGIHTVCVIDQKLAKERGQQQYMANVALKFNLKKGGINQKLPTDKLGFLKDGKTMVMGIDVTHPSPTSVTGAPSIVGVVASTDALLGQWPASIRVQEGRKEMVTELTEMVMERLRLWRKKNSDTLPEQILVYRDGVSEGQYDTVLREELPCFYAAFEKIYPAKAKKPKVSIVIVGKRHHTRFYPVKQEDADRGGNPKNGTVVDRGITKYWEFYLQAHTGLQGTARPAHYVVVRDEIGLGADGLEQLTHNICYLFGRATKSVSICPPAYYADLLCERGRCYLHGTMNTEGGAGAAFNVNQAEWTRGVHPTLEETMFYI